MRTAITYLWIWILHLAVQTVVSSTSCGGYRSNSLSDNFYERKLFNFIWVLHKCGPGLVWKQALCQCIRPRTLQQIIRHTSRECPDRPPILTTSANRSPSTLFPGATTSVQGRNKARTIPWKGKTNFFTERYPFPLPQNKGVPCSQYRPNADNKLQFDHKDAGGKWQVQQCAPGTRWSQKLCTCVFIQPKDNISPGLIKSVYCEVILLIPFDGSIQDESPIKSYIGQSNHHGIKVTEQGAFFDGTSSLNIPFFNGNFMGNVFLVQFSFKIASTEMNEAPDKIMTLLSNGCKDNPPSLHLTYTTGRDFIVLETATVFQSVKSLACPTLMDADGWSHVSLEFCPTSYAIFVNGNMCSRSPLKGSIDITNCDLVLGQNFYTSSSEVRTIPFMGFLDNVNITRGCACINQPMLPFDIEPLSL